MSDDKVRYAITRRDPTEATVEVTIAPDEVARGVESIYREYAREVRIPGFRKGHVPRHLLESRFGRETFLAEAKAELRRQYAPQAFDELGLQPVTTPQLEEDPHAEGEPLVFRLTFSVLPEIVLPKLEELDATVPRLVPVSEEDVRLALEDVSEHFSTLEEKEGGTVSEGDIVHVREGDREWDARAAADGPIASRLIGAAVGSDVEIDVELADGERVQTTLSVVGLRQIVLPEIDDELAKDAGFDDLDALKADILAQLAKQRSEQHAQLTHTRLVDGLIERTDIPLPDAFLDELVDEELERVKGSFTSKTSSLTFDEYLARREQSEEGLRQEIRDAASRRVRRELTLRRLAKHFEIAVDDDELTRLAEAEAADRDEDPLRFVAQIRANERWEDYRAAKVNERVFEALRRAATVREEET